jgi:hypothetical protein
MLTTDPPATAGGTDVDPTVIPFRQSRTGLFRGYVKLKQRKMEMVCSGGKFDGVALASSSDPPLDSAR